MSRVRRAKQGAIKMAKPATRLGFCRECNKQTFASRKEARSDARKSFPHE
jgi:hypothetical protein